MNINEILEKLKKDSNDYFFLHDMKLPITAEKMYNIMSNPGNWPIVNFPIINNVHMVDREGDKAIFYLNEKILGKYYRSQIILKSDDTKKKIEYNHINPVFPFVNKMSSIWYFENEDESLSHFYIIRRFNIKNDFIKIFLFWFVKRVINNHVEDYYKQLIVLTKSISLSKISVNS